ncbi:hypothetical protein [Desmospora profundinema]|uniref:Uncharacterized protein n=1 Tax=Desmospora profundinema TaxID=1571184 RepID=A0ABU1IJ66_9BACL|nr:hypothetical protein [Desmospora profundinema]MDR6224721.1 hypothetical protein [Desmospora profundinema]
MAWKDHRYQELKEILPRIDVAVQTLLRLEEPVAHEKVLSVWHEAQWLQERVHQQGLVQRHPQVHEVVSFLSLSSFSLLYLHGESFQTYREELQSRYKSLLRWVYFFPKYASNAEDRRISNL